MTSSPPPRDQPPPAGRALVQRSHDEPRRREDDAAPDLRFHQTTAVALLRRAGAEDRRARLRWRGGDDPQGRSHRAGGGPGRAPEDGRGAREHGLKMTIMTSSINEVNKVNEAQLRTAARLGIKLYPHPVLPVRPEAPADASAEGTSQEGRRAGRPEHRAGDRRLLPEPLGSPARGRPDLGPQPLTPWHPEERVRRGVRHPTRYPSRAARPGTRTSRSFATTSTSSTSRTSSG